MASIALPEWPLKLTSWWLDSRLRSHSLTLCQVHQWLTLKMCSCYSLSIQNQKNTDSCLLLLGFWLKISCRTIELNATDISCAFQDNFELLVCLVLTTSWAYYWKCLSLYVMIFCLSANNMKSCVFLFSLLTRRTVNLNISLSCYFALTSS